jgi:hypothetical protein
MLALRWSGATSVGGAADGEKSENSIENQTKVIIANKVQSHTKDPSV